jgi:hypothetical protein
MTLLVGYLGDLVATATVHQTLDPANDSALMPYHYTLHFRDVTSGKTAEISYTTENDMVLAFAAWLVADEENIGLLEPHRTELADKLPKGFMP